jgi:hypothetical protein
MNYTFDSIKGKLRLGVIVGPNTNTFASKTITFNIDEDIITFGRQILVDRSKALTDYTPSYPGKPTLFSFSGQSNVEVPRSYPGIGTIFIDIFSRNYDFKYKGKGLISLNDDKKLTNTQGFRSPYNASGAFVVSGIGGPAFVPTPYIATGSLNVYGDSLNRKISVYGYYGDSGEFSTSGSIEISQQTLTTKESQSKSYSGSGILFSVVTSVSKKSYAYNGDGNISISGTSSESTSVDSRSNTQLFTFSNSSLNNFSRQTVTNTSIYSISGYSSVEVGYVNVSLAQILINGSSTSTYARNNVSTVLFKFTRHDVDNTYDTCDNEEIKCDDQYSAISKVSFNPSQRVALFAFDGTSNTQINSTYSYDAFGNHQLSGSYSGLKFGYSSVGNGTLSSLTSYNGVNTKDYVGKVATLNILGSSQSSITKLPPSSGILYTISGYSPSKIEFEYSFNQNGLINIEGHGNTRKLSVYSNVGFVDFNLYGELNHPNVRFLPSTITGGFINISGHSEESITRVYTETFGTLFSICFGLESFSKSSYVGIGSIYVQEISSPTINNPYQIPRTYVSII